MLKGFETGTRCANNRLKDKYNNLDTMLFDKHITRNDFETPING